MRATSGWRTTSAQVKCVVAMPSTRRRMRSASTRPLSCALGQVDLADVAGDHGLGAEADARQEHLHLLGRRVLRLVEDDEGMVQRAAAHEGQRRDLERRLLEGLADAVEAHQVVQRVVQRPQVGIDLLRQVAGQEAEPLAGLDRRPREHDALHRAALERVDRAGDGEVGLAGAGRADAEGDVVVERCCSGTTLWFGVRPARSLRRVRRRRSGRRRPRPAPRRRRPSLRPAVGPRCRRRPSPRGSRAPPRRRRSAAPPDRRAAAARRPRARHWPWRPRPGTTRCAAGS